jgi:acyl-CoA synthetase (AMP-forming)/AMP-acid ligase II
MSDVVRLVRHHAERSPSAVALLAPRRAPLTYGRLLRQVEQVVATLNSLGVGRGDRVAMVLPEGPELAAALVAIGAGATCAPLNPAYRASEFEWALADIRAAALVAPAGSASPAVHLARSRGIAVLELSADPGTEAGTFALAGEARPPPPRPGFAGPDDRLLVLHTSGTAARPKLVPLTHRNVVASARDIAAVLELTDRDRCLNVMPLFHIHGQSTVWSSLAAGASVVCTPGFAAGEFLDWLEEFHPSWYTAAPSIHRSVLAEALRRPEAAAQSTLRFIRSASSAMPSQLIAGMERAA